jgi:hypothetical protein
MLTSTGLGKVLRQNINNSATGSLGYNAMKQHKPWFNEECINISDERNQAKPHWVQKPSKINGDNLNAL